MGGSEFKEPFLEIVRGGWLMLCLEIMEGESGGVGGGRVGEVGISIGISNVDAAELVDAVVDDDVVADDDVDDDEIER